MDKKMLNKVKGFNPVNDFDEDWIKTSINEKAIEYSEKMGFFLCNYIENKGKMIMGRGALSNSQIRNVFGEVKRIQMKLKGTTEAEKVWNENKSAFLLLQPKLAYAAGRAKQKQKSSVLPTLASVLTKAAISVEADKDNAYKRYNNFVDFLESILAFHKAFGGKEN